VSSQAEATRGRAFPPPLPRGQAGARVPEQRCRVRLARARVPGSERRRAEPPKEPEQPAAEAAKRPAEQKALIAAKQASRQAAEAAKRLPAARCRSPPPALELQASTATAAEPGTVPQYTRRKPGDAFAQHIIQP